MSARNRAKPRNLMRVSSRAPCSRKDDKFTTKCTSSANANGLASRRRNSPPLTTSPKLPKKDPGRPSRRSTRPPRRLPRGRPRKTFRGLKHASRALCTPSNARGLSAPKTPKCIAAHSAISPSVNLGLFGPRRSICCQSWYANMRNQGSAPPRRRPPPAIPRISPYGIPPPANIVPCAPPMCDEEGQGNFDEVVNCGVTDLRSEGI